MEKVFHKDQIVKLANELRRDGLTWQQIADHLTSKGYFNSKGKPYTEGGIWTLVTVAQDPNYKHRLVRHQVPRSPEKKMVANRDQTIIVLRKSIINLEGVSAEKKLELLDQTYGL